MHTENPLIYVLIFLSTAVILVPIFKKSGLGSILGYLMAGLLLGPHVLDVIPDPEAVLHFSEYGVILLLFIIGLELAPDKLWSMRWQIGLIGGSQLVVSAVLLGAGFYWLLGSSFVEAVVLGLTLALSSTAFAIQLMNEERILATPLGRKGFSILLLQDIAVIPILILVGILSNSGVEESTNAWYLAPVAVVALLLISRFALNPLLRFVAQTNNREIMAAAALLIVVAMAVLMDVAGLSMGLGAFIAGIMLANSDFRHQLESDIEPFKGLLLGLFFIAVGMTINVPLLFNQPWIILSAALVLVAIKTCVIAIILRQRHVAFKDGITLGLMLSQGGEFAFVILTQAVQSSLIPVELSDQLTLVVGLSMAMTSPLLALLRKLMGAENNRSKYDSHWDVHQPEVVIAGFGRFGQVIGRMLQANQIPFTAMDKNATHVEFIKRFGNRIFFGDMRRLDLLKSAGVKHAKILVVAVNDIEESLEIVDVAQKQNSRLIIIARAINRNHAYELYRRQVHSVIRETFSSSLEAASETLEQLGFTEGQALEFAELFRFHDEALLKQAVAHKDNMEELLQISAQGRKELQQLFEKDRDEAVSS